MDHRDEDNEETSPITQHLEQAIQTGAMKDFGSPAICSIQIPCPTACQHRSIPACPGSMAIDSWATTKDIQ